jgi:hypothetical protein
MDRVELVGEDLSISENIVVKLSTPLTEEIDEVVSISENVTIKVTEQEIFPAPSPGGGFIIRKQPPKIRQKRRVWPTMSMETYKPTKYVRQDRQYEPPTLQQQLDGPRTKVRHAFVGIYDILAPSAALLEMQEAQQRIESLSQDILQAQNAQIPTQIPELLEMLQLKTTQPRKPHRVAKSFVGKYDIYSKINKPFTLQYEKATLVSKTFIASYDIKVFDWAKLSKLQTARTLIAAISTMESLEDIEDLSE